ncbi:shikimate kinase [Proteiniclasticum ruminis]|uniref:Shikimate kinase n=1 Tax=Proteiniclasticum ruminis TaxID=398199 RepID=A0A1I4Y5J2_9CLOT|nr:shikimate kinase [Proteiniclasticum ruminis]SFN33352.1 shikimate kinase [Proteiniclasticum ruminis]
MRPIFLVGMPGCGKTTIGKELAKKMELDFLDTDEEIKRAYGRTPEQIIEEDGEKRLRVLELELLSGIMNLKNVVVSTGGGLPIFNENMSKLNTSGITVYLSCSADTLWKRLRNDRTRPLSRTYEEVKSMLEKREPEYLKASYHVHTDGKTQIGTQIQNLYEVLRNEWTK